MHRSCAVLILICFLAIHCGGGASTQKVVTWPGPVGTGASDTALTETGSITLVFSSRAQGLVLAINGTLLVDKATVKRLHIKGVPAGYADIAIAVQGVDRQMRVWVESGRDTSVPVAGPPTPPSQNPLLTAGLSVLAFLISRAATEALF